MPTAATILFSGDKLEPIKDPDRARRDVINLVTGTYAKGTVVGEVSASPGTFKAYASGNVDGSQNPTHLLEYACIVAGGVISFGDTAGGEWKATSKGAPAYRNGEFNAADLVGLDAAGLAKLQGRIVEGDISTGRIYIP